MTIVALMDTSVFLNILDAPGFNGDADAVLHQFATLVEAGAQFLLPMATIVETGNHIAHITDGRLRRDRAELFVSQVTAAFTGKAPWSPTAFPTTDQMAAWLHRFPDCAMREMGLGDLTIQVEWERACQLFPRHRVFIWSLDHHLSCFDRAAAP